MKIIKTPKTFQDFPKKYDDLVKIFMPRTIHDDHELDNATEITDLLAGHNLNKDQEDFLETIATLIEEYENKHYPIFENKVSGVDALKFLLESNDLNAADLSRILNVHRSLGPKILNGERKLTAEHIKLLCDRFKVSADTFFH
jgi:HTH-type transcriptional regulator/antitoxin HigA